MDDAARTPRAVPEDILRLLRRPNVRLAGEINDDMLKSFREQVDAALEEEGPLVVELSTPGGDADTGLRLAEDMRLIQERLDREVWFLGKASVYSAGVTVMAAAPVERRWLSACTTLLIHSRRLSKDVHLEGPLQECRRRLQELVSETENGERLERESHERLIRGSRVSLEELQARAHTNWYVPADEAVELGLVAGTL